MTEKKKASKSKMKKVLAGAASLLVIGAGGGLVGSAIDNDNSAHVTNLTEQVAELQEQLEASNAEIADLNGQLGEYSEYDQEISEAVAEDAAIEEAKDYVLRKDHRLKDWLEDEFNLDIEDEEDLDLTFLDEEVTDTDYDDGDFTVEFDLKVEGFENGDNDEDFTRYVRVTVEIEEGDAESVSFSEA